MVNIKLIVKNIICENENYIGLDLTFNEICESDERIKYIYNSVVEILENKFPQCCRADGECYTTAEKIAERQKIRYHADSLITAYFNNLDDVEMMNEMEVLGNSMTDIGYTIRTARTREQFEAQMDSHICDIVNGVEMDNETLGNLLRRG